jgi:hypothetical protein
MPGMKLVLAAALLVTTVASRPARADAKFEELAAKLVSVFERVAADADANKGDCDKMTVALNKHVDADAEIVKAAKANDAKMTKEERAEAKKVLETKFGARMKAALQKGNKPLKACNKHAGVKAFMAKTGL